uniref:Uncharacterized protein n=1 Tax=Timema poppense TaxID=170557 RepID=A0A7R9DN07_TIMPO|nr:unnamed protein product [Timema poppensis]
MSCTLPDLHHISAASSFNLNTLHHWHALHHWHILLMSPREMALEGDKTRNIERRNTDEGGQKEKSTCGEKGGTSFLGSPLESLDMEWYVHLEMSPRQFSFEEEFPHRATLNTIPCKEFVAAENFKDKLEEFSARHQLIVGELKMKPRSCDTFVVLPPLTAHGGVVFGKNSDRPNGEVQELVYQPAQDHSADSKLQVGATNL